MPGKVDPRPYGEKRFDEPFPADTIATPCYFHYDDLASLPKVGEYRAIFVARDPRDILVSWYFSARYSHGLMGNLATLRRELESRSKDEGIAFLADHLDTRGVFRAMHSWLAAAADPHVLVVRFEDLVDPSRSLNEFRLLMEHCDIEMPVRVLREVLDTYSFEALSGRAAGQEDQRSHYRKGTPGDWRNHLNKEAAEAVAALTGDVLTGFEFE